MQSKYTYGVQSEGSWEWLRYEIEWYMFFSSTTCPFDIWHWHGHYFTELARIASRGLAFQHKVFLSSLACCLSVGNYILWISCFPRCVTFYIYIWSVLSALSNPMFFPSCTFPIPVTAQGFAELTLLLFSFLLLLPIGSQHFIGVPYIKVLLSALSHLLSSLSSI